MGLLGKVFGVLSIAGLGVVVGILSWTLTEVFRGFVLAAYGYYKSDKFAFLFPHFIVGVMAILLFLAVSK